MRKYLRSLLLCSLGLSALIPSVANAQKLDASAGFIVSDFTYEEPGVMKETGNLYGINGQLTSRGDELMLRAEASFLRGKVDYTSVRTGSVDGIQDYIYELRALIGKTSKMRGGGTLSAYIGLGYRYLNDDSTDFVSTTNATGYEREQRYYYMPAGLLINAPLSNSDWTLEAQLEIDYLIRGKNTSQVSTSAGSELNFTQENGYGARASAAFIKNIDQKTIKGVSIAPYLKYWDIDTSDRVRVGNTIYWEPANETTEFGVIFSLHFTN